MEDGSNCLLTQDGDDERAADLLELATQLMKEGRTSDLTKEAIHTARRFSPGREAAEVLRFWRAFLEPHSSDSSRTAPVNPIKKGQP
jgi:hypothetical protein